MAEQITQDVVNEVQSMGGPSPIDESATTTSFTAAGDGLAQQQPTSASLEPADPKQAENATAGQTTDVEEARAGTPSMVGESVDGSLQVPSEDAGSAAAVVDLSGGSDTDSSRPDGLELNKELSGHVRSNSIKKPTTFKSVSVTKSFLAKAATASPVLKGVTDSRGNLKTVLFFAA